MIDIISSRLRPSKMTPTIEKLRNADVMPHNVGAMKMTDMNMKMQDMKLTDQFAGHLQGGMKLQDRKYSVNRDYITLQ